MGNPRETRSGLVLVSFIVIAHSIGGAATLLAVRNGLRLDRVVLLAPPSDMRGFIDLFGEHIGLPQRSQQGMARRAAAWFGIDWRQMEVAHWAEGDLPPVLVFHDRGDRVVPLGHGERIRAVWGRAELITTEGLGHRRIRRDDDVIRRAVSFLGSALPGRRTPDTLRR